MRISKSAISLKLTLGLISVFLFYYILRPHSSISALLHSLFDVSVYDEELPATPMGQDINVPDAPLSRHPIYKDNITTRLGNITDSFPAAFSAASPDHLPHLAVQSRPPTQHVPEPTPLFIGFTRNWNLLQQTVVSYITAGWPPEDIFVVENTGVMNSNRDKLLSIQNPFFLNHTRLDIFKVNVIQTPTLLSFSQLQNFFTFTALRKGWETYWWAHMDTIALSNGTARPFKSLYRKAVDALREVKATGKPDWAIVFHAYDHLALVNTRANVELGGWDTQIPFYKSDCDMHSRYHMAGYITPEIPIGHILDVAETLPDLGVLYRQEDHEAILVAAQEMQAKKIDAGRNTWQSEQRGGQGEPFYRDSSGFEQAQWMHIDLGHAVFAEKWGHRGCDIIEAGLGANDAWRVKKDWEQPVS